MGIGDDLMTVRPVGSNRTHRTDVATVAAVVSAIGATSGDIERYSTNSLKAINPVDIGFLPIPTGFSD